MDKKKIKRIIAREGLIFVIWLIFVLFLIRLYPLVQSYGRTITTILLQFLYVGYFIYLFIRLSVWISMLLGGNISSRVLGIFFILIGISAIKTKEIGLDVSDFSRYTGSDAVIIGLGFAILGFYLFIKPPYKNK